MAQYQVPTPDAAPGLDDSGNPADNEQLETPLQPNESQDPNDPGPPPGDFKTWQEVALSLENLRAHMASKGTKTPESSDAPKAPQPGEIRELTQDDMATLYNEWTANGGTLTPQTYQRLQMEHGVTQATVEQFVQGQQAQAQLEAQAMYSAVGGQEQFEQMAQWARRELPAQEFQAVNRLIANANATGDVGVIQMAVQSLAQRWQAAEGYSQGRGLAPTQAPRQAPAGGQPFMSMAQLVEAQSDPRYVKDPAYRREVEQRVALSARAGTL